MRSESRATGDGALAGFVFWALMGLLAWAPLPLASNRPWAWSLLALAVGMLLVLWALAALRRPRLMRLGWRAMAVPAALAFGAVSWFLLQASPLLPPDWHAPVWRMAAAALGRPLDGAVSIDPAASVGGAMRLAAYGGAFWLAAQYGRDPARAPAVLWTVAAAGLAYAVYGLAVHLSGSETILWLDKWSYRGDLTSTFVNRNAYGVYAGIGMLAALALMARMAEQADNGGFGGMAGVARFLDRLDPMFFVLVAAWITLATALAFSHSRGALAATAAATALYVAALGLAARGRRRAVAVAAVALLVAGAVVVEVSGRGTLGRVVALADEDTGRGPIHALTRRAIDAAPWTGHGLDTFPQVYYRWRDGSIPWESPRYDKAHGAYLELALEAGWPAFAAIMAALGWIVAGIAAGVVRRRQRAVYPCLGLAATLLVGLQAIWDFAIQMPAVAFTYFALLGVAYAQSFPTRAPDSVRTG